MARRRREGPTPSSLHSFYSVASSVDREDLGPPGAARRVDLDLIARLLAEQRSAGRRLRRDAADARDPYMQALAPLVFELDLRADLDRVRAADVLDQQDPAEAIAEQRDAPFQQALLVLRRVVLEVLRQIAEAARARDRLDDVRSARTFELGQLGFELL